MDKKYIGAYKPDSNRTNLSPDFYIRETDKWLMFPHEAEGMSAEEIRADKPGQEAITELNEILKE